MATGIFTSPVPAAAASTNTLDELRPLKPPVDIPAGWVWWGGLAAALLLILFLVLAVRRWRQRLAAAPARREPPDPPHVEARRRLEAAWQWLSDPERFTVAVSSALRWYLERRFHLPAPERTTEEFLLELQRTLALQPRHKELLADFLRECDLVKFARHEPAEESLRRLHAAALRLVDETSISPETAPPGMASSASAQSPTRPA